MIHRSLDGRIGLLSIAISIPVPIATAIFPLLRTIRSVMPSFATLVAGHLTWILLAVTIAAISSIPIMMPMAVVIVTVVMTMAIMVVAIVLVRRSVIMHMGWWR